MLDAVIVRDSRGRLHRMVALGASHGLIYAAKREALPSVEAGVISAVGFPERDVFVDDSKDIGRLPEEDTLTRYRG